MISSWVCCRSGERHKVEINSGGMPTTESLPWQHKNPIEGDLDIEDHEADLQNGIQDSEEAEVVAGHDAGEAANGSQSAADSRDAFTLKEILETAWADVMQGTVPSATVAGWEILNGRLMKLRTAGAVIDSQNQQLVQDPPHRNLQDSKIMPTPSELAFLRASRNCTEEEFQEWLTVVKDPHFDSSPNQLRFSSAKQAKRYLQRTAANFCKLEIKQHEFSRNDGEPSPSV
jgi:hypothetical protein